MSKAIDEMRKEIVIETLVSLVRKKLLSVKDAADEANMSVEEFEKLV